MSPLPDSSESAYLEGDFSITNAEHMLMVRAATWTRRRYGLNSPLDWRPFHDRAARRAYDRLLRGEALPEPSGFRLDPWHPPVTFHITQRRW